jgi:hypothetical protein
MTVSSGTGGEVVNAQVCKTCTRGFNSRPVLQQFFLFLAEIPLKKKPGISGEVANAQVCKTCIRGFNSRLVLQQSSGPATRGCMKESEHGYLW